MLSLETNKKPLEFTQYLQPDGRKKQVVTMVSEEIHIMAEAIIEAGNRFECEVLRTSQVSLTITNDEFGDVAFEVVPNGPAVPEAIERMIRRYHARMQIGREWSVNGESPDKSTT